MEKYRVFNEWRCVVCGIERLLDVRNERKLCVEQLNRMSIKEKELFYIGG